MKRKLMLIVTVMLVVFSVFSLNSFAGSNSYDTTTRVYQGAGYNGSSGNATAHGRATPSIGGVTLFQICSESGNTIHKTGIYPANPINYNSTTYTIPAYYNCSFYVESQVHGQQIVGTTSFGVY